MKITRLDIKSASSVGSVCQVDKATDKWELSWVKAFGQVISLANYFC